MYNYQGAAVHGCFVCDLETKFILPVLGLHLVLPPFALDCTFHMELRNVLDASLLLGTALESIFNHLGAAVHAWLCL